MIIIRQLFTHSKTQPTTTFMLTRLIKVNNPNIAVSFQYVSLREISMNESSFMYFYELLEDAKSLEREIWLSKKIIFLDIRGSVRKIYTHRRSTERRSKGC